MRVAPTIAGARRDIAAGKPADETPPLLAAWDEESAPETDEKPSSILELGCKAGAEALGENM